LRREFVSLVSHELRTPLTSIIGFLDLIAADPQREGAQEYFSIVHRNAERLLALVGDVLLATTLDTGRLTLHRERVSLSELAEHAVEAAKPHAEGAGVAVEIDANGDATVSGDELRLGQVVDNLVSNAVKFTREGRPRHRANRKKCPPYCARGRGHRHRDPTGGAAADVRAVLPHVGRPRPGYPG
jgi:signal transduction histidine kinase